MRINENESVQKVFILLQNHNMEQEKQDMESIVKHMGQLELQFEKVYQELGDVKDQLEQIQNKDIRKVAANTVKVVEKKVKDVGEQFLSTKDNFFHSIDEGLNTFKEQGTKAFHKTLNIFRIKSTLIQVRNGLENCATACHKAADKTEKMTEEMGIIGGHAKNIGRLFTGKQPIKVTVNQKDTGILQGIKNCFTNVGVRLSRMAKATESAIGKVEQLEKRTEKSSVRKELSDLKNKKLNGKQENIKSQERGR